jgi:hypothetical protein
MPEPIFMKHGMLTMALEPISTAYFIIAFHQSVCLYVYPPIFATQRLFKNVTAATNTQSTIEELLDALFSMRSASYRRAVSVSVYPISLLDNGSVNRFLRRRIHNDRRFFKGVVFYVLCVVSKKSRRLVLPRTSCLLFYTELQWQLTTNLYYLVVSASL